jgi:hypothetical protein
MDVINRPFDIIIRLHGDPDPLRLMGIFLGAPAEPESMEELMMVAHHDLLGDLDTSGMERLVLHDENYNIYIIIIKEIQSISIMAPDKL